VFRRGEPPDATYVFKHALVRDAAYETLLRARRTALHGAVATALEHDANLAAVQPALVGHHYAEAGMPAEAAMWLLRAGQQAAARSAMVEAWTQLSRGLRIAEEIDESTEPRLRMAELLLALGTYRWPRTGSGRMNTELHLPKRRGSVADSIQRTVMPPGYWYVPCSAIGLMYCIPAKLMPRTLLPRRSSRLDVTTLTWVYAALPRSPMA
jgi:hypothetical protein